MTAWARKLTHSATFWCLVAGFILGSIFLLTRPQPDVAGVAGQSFNIERADTEASRKKGLSGRDSIGAKDAMLFVFDKPGQRCMWMKDMKFSIDMVWLDASKRIVAIEHNVSPDTYPKNFCHDNAQYVLEFAAGTAKRLGLSTEAVQL